jgi:hypothetical protein
VFGMNTAFFRTSALKLPHCQPTANFDLARI